MRSQVAVPADTVWCTLSVHINEQTEEEGREEGREGGMEGGVNTMEDGTRIVGACLRAPSPARPRVSDACARCGATTDAAWPRSTCCPCSRRGAMAESLYIYLWRNTALDVPAATARGQQHPPPATRPPRAHARTDDTHSVAVSSVVDAARRRVVASLQ